MCGICTYVCVHVYMPVSSHGMTRGGWWGSCSVMLHFIPHTILSYYKHINIVILGGECRLVGKKFA